LQGRDRQKAVSSLTVSPEKRIFEGCGKFVADGVKSSRMTATPDIKHDSPIAREGFPFIAVAAIAALIAFWFGLSWVAAGLLLVTLFIAWFFRNPERRVPGNPRQVVSPADGKVIRIEEVDDADFGGETVRKISIFMNIFNVHVNRIPYPGEVVSIVYRPGKFFSADLDKASEHNERNAVLIRSQDGQRIKTVQIAGLIARRIVCWIQEGLVIDKGERFGLIRFGSRVEVYLQLQARILVRVGDKVRAGETPMGEMP
jgi:phosphatidylserine decarboxylase